MPKQPLDLRQKHEEVTVIEQPKTVPGGGRVLLEWEAPEFVVYKKTTGWYVGFGVLLALLLFAAFLLQSLLTGIVFILAGILIFVHAEKPPRIIGYDVRTTGVRIDERIYMFRELAAFNVVQHANDEAYLLLKSKRLVMPLIHVPLGNSDAEEVTETLSKYIPQDINFVEPLADVLAHWAGF